MARKMKLQGSSKRLATLDAKIKVQKKKGVLADPSVKCSKLKKKGHDVLYKRSSQQVRL